MKVAPMRETFSEQLLELGMSRISSWTAFCLAEGTYDSNSFVSAEPVEAAFHLKSPREIAFTMQFQAHPGLRVHTNTIMLTPNYAFGPLVAAITWPRDLVLSQEIVAAVEKAINYPPCSWLDILGYSSKADRLIKEKFAPRKPGTTVRNEHELLHGLLSYLYVLRKSSNPAADRYADFLFEKAEEWAGSPIREDGLPPFTGYTPFYNLFQVANRFVFLTKRGEARSYIMDNP